ncbi:hypothetical protein GSH05_05840 [Burkholderia pseudomallei]|uniref:Uncharacterized protein n=1 Tax=Burkholderia pseudomallei TaxID=28450 RepID=A0AAX0U2G4_BURPE|nr:hypothetical protein BOC35_19225 [Burkholderia pseudomallei]PNX00950.1 hypothetical protein CF649_20930 [Burkholderia sp. 136(2017)]PNX26662.1 hypothetical protein CF647_24850 [Burkholderia sp. 117]PNX36308.1 hypothetical protein CF648_21840 [Burkholderia sp. 137]ARK54689.1 hypothetical protein BOC36_17295 [Burkholderia pseudomallei]
MRPRRAARARHERIGRCFQANRKKRTSSTRTKGMKAAAAHRQYAPTPRPRKCTGFAARCAALSGLRPVAVRHPRVILSQPDHGLEPCPPRQIAAITHR